MMFTHNFYTVPKSRSRGTSLIELLIYLAVFAVLVVSITNIFLVTLRIRARENSRFAINENARVVLGTIRDALLDADTATISGTCPGNELGITTGATTTTFRITNGTLEVVQNTDPAKALTADTVMASTSAPCLFAKIENPPPAKPTVQIKMRMISSTPGNPAGTISQDYQLTVSLR